jgi:DeoR/GlpR family transcriptional regulator of sugar metabolism
MQTTDPRRGAIQALLAQHGEVGFAELAERFDVSEMTIRRDLEILESQGVARRVRGGAISTVSRGHEPPFAMRAAEALPAKQRIAQVAAQQIDYGETAIIDVGTTTLELARCLKGRSALTIVTPSIHAALELANEPNLRVILTGGILRAGELSLIGDFAERTLAGLNCDVLFMGVGGIHAEKGLTEYNLDDSRVKRAALQTASRRVVLADASKLNRVCLATVASLEEIDVLITDADEDQPMVGAAREAGVEVISVNDKESS